MALPLLAVPAIISGVTAAAGMTGSFIDMGKQRRARDKAEKAAAKAAAEAKAALAVAPFEALGLSIDPTQRAMDVATSIGMAGVEVGRESQRGAAAAAGRAQAIGAQQAMAARDQFTKELEQRERLIAQDAARRQTALANIALQEATGAQIAAGEAEASRRASLQSGLEGLQQVGAAAAEGFDLYAGNRPPDETDETGFTPTMDFRESLFGPSAGDLTLGSYFARQQKGTMPGDNIISALSDKMPFGGISPVRGFRRQLFEINEP